MNNGLKLALWTHKIGTPLFFFLFSIFVSSLLFLFNKPEDGTIFLLSLFVVSGLVGLLKILFAIARPIDAMFVLSSGAFPSGHSAGVAFLMVGLLFVLKDLLPLHLYMSVGVLLGCTVLLVAWSRVAIRVHTPFQVFVGLSIGFVLSIAIFMNQDIVLSLL